MNGLGLDRFRYFNWCAVIINPVIIYHLTIFIKCNVLWFIIFINIIKFEYYIFRTSNFKHTITNKYRKVVRDSIQIFVYPNIWTFIIAFQII